MADGGPGTKMVQPRGKHFGHKMGPPRDVCEECMHGVQVEIDCARETLAEDRDDASTEQYLRQQLIYMQNLRRLSLASAP